MTTIEHPKYPLQDEERLENEMALTIGTLTGAAVLARRVQFNKRRDTEFPGWRDRYKSELDAWLIATGQKKAPRPKRRAADVIDPAASEDPWAGEIPFSACDASSGTLEG